MSVLLQYYFRNSGNLYGGKLNLTHMGFYSSNNKLLNITFRETTIIRRLNVNGIHIRTMIVVCILTKCIQLPRIFFN